MKREFQAGIAKSTPHLSAAGQAKSAKRDRALNHKFCLKKKFSCFACPPTETNTISIDSSLSPPARMCVVLFFIFLLAHSMLWIWCCF